MFEGSQIEDFMKQDVKRNSSAYFISFLLLFLIAAELCIIFYILFRGPTDFLSFYKSSRALAFKNPYLYSNINPPITLFLFYPLFQLPATLALWLWAFLSLFAGGIALFLIAMQFCSIDFIKRNALYFLVFYLSFYFARINLEISQMGLFLLFFLSLGYHYFAKKKEVLAGISWGLLIALKFFPALLFIFALQQKRYQLFCVMLFSSAVFFFLPYFWYGAEIYHKYFYLMSLISWYTQPWNAALYGFLARILKYFSLYSVELLQGTFLVFFFLCLFWYWKKMKLASLHEAPYAFALTIVVMLFLSPLGWIYYAAMLIFPIILLWQHLETKQASTGEYVLFLISLFILNFPIKLYPNLLGEAPNPSGQTVFLIGSWYFYGLLILGFLFRKPFTLQVKMEGFIFKSLFVYAALLVLGESVVSFIYYVYCTDPPRNLIFF